ncbi:hypothetical protein VTO42DRAFT_7154 [Malbranchea cinnamomea]
MPEENRHHDSHIAEENRPSTTQPLAAETVSSPSTMESNRTESEQPVASSPDSTSSKPTCSGSFLDRLQRRQNAKSVDSIPRQSITESLASNNERVGSGSLSASVAEILGPSSSGVSRQTHGSSRRIRKPVPLSGARARTQSTGRFPLLSPCYFHQRFDDAVNIEKVLEEIAADDAMSHSRLVQTATGVREVSKQLQRRPIKLEVKNVMIVTKARDNNLVYLTRELAEWLLSTPRYGSDLGVNVYVDAKLQSSKRFNAAGLLEKEPRFKNMLKYWTPDLCWTEPETFDLVITLGGDGTVLYTSWLFQRIVPPVLAFSLGSLGFLTNFEFSKYREHLNRIMGDIGMRVNLRMRFTCTVYRVDRQSRQRPPPVVEERRVEVVNEMVIDRGPSPYVSNLEVYGDNELLTVVQADGCIFSTPTGSTAYSLSAGGSLIHPSIPAILLTPICPHTLSFRPMVLSDTLLLRIAIPHGSRSSAYCSFDGKGRIELRQGDYVTVEASAYPFPTVVSSGGEWFESVRRTLQWNVRGAVQKGWNGPRDGPQDGDPTNGEDSGEEEEEEWDIDTDADPPGTDSGFGPSEAGDSPTGGSTSPIRRQTSMLNM